MEELFSRQLAADGEESDALKLPNLSTVGKIFSFGAPIVSGIIDHFKNKYVIRSYWSTKKYSHLAVD